MADLPCNPIQSSLFTDLYALSMGQVYFDENLTDVATFELFFRKMPPTRNYMVAAGLDEVLTYLENFHFSVDDLAYLHRLGSYSTAFLEHLGELRFSGDVYAVPEGTIVFPNEPLVQIVAPLLEAQLVETLVLNQIHFQTIVASKAARVMTAAKNKIVVDFGSRRAHGTDAALKVARVSYLSGAAGTSLVLAGKLYRIPVFGTMAHSFIQAYDDEASAFEAFLRLYPNATILVDTYDTLNGIQKLIALRRKLGDRFSVRAIRLDSGDIAELSRQAREMLDAAQLERVQIFVSSELDEYEIAKLTSSGAPIDGFGVGTKMAIADEASHIDMAYKLVEYAGEPRTKLSSEKTIYPWRKQVYRFSSDDRMRRDVIGRPSDHLSAEPLLEPVMYEGQRLAAGQKSLDEIRHFALNERDRVPEELRTLTPASHPYPVEVTDELNDEFQKLRSRIQSTNHR